MCRVDRFGFPRGLSKSEKRPFNFQTGDLVKASVPKGKKKGFHVGRIAVRSSGNFNIQTDSSVVQGISYRHCRIMQRSDGYNYGFKPWRLPPSAKAEGIRRLAN